MLLFGFGWSWLSNLLRFASRNSGSGTCLQGFRLREPKLDVHKEIRRLKVIPKQKKGEMRQGTEGEEKTGA